MTAKRPNPKGAKAASIEDVAAAAAVSTATVSRVLNNPELVSAATARRVQQAIHDLDYRPNILAKGLSTRKTRVLGIALPDIFGEFYSELLRGADGEARRSGYHLLVSSEGRIRNGDGPDGSLAFGLIDGMALMITEPDGGLLPEALRAGIPLVVLDTEPQGQQCDSVVVDNECGAREALHHLLESVPPERCCFVGGPKENFDTVQRAAAFRAALAERGHTARPEQLWFGTYTTDWGQRWAAEHIVKAPQGSRWSGVLAGNDEIAYGIMVACLDAGIAIPRELRLIGFDDSRVASLVRPTLSSVRVPAAEIGAAAVRLLMERIKDPDRPPQHLTLPTNLVIRESSGAT